MSPTIQEYQRQVREGLMVSTHVDPLTHCALGLCGEAGEVADIIKKSQYRGAPPIDEAHVKEELSDVIWYVTAIADRFGWSLEELMLSNITKLAARYPQHYDLTQMQKAMLP